MVRKTGEGLTLFALDDEKDICFFMEKIFTAMGFNVHTAMTGQAAVNLLKVVRPDIAVLDIYLSKGTMNGIDVLKFIKTQWPRCACLMMTRADDRKLIDQSTALGAVDYLLKPMTLVKVKRAISKITKKLGKGG